MAKRGRKPVDLKALLFWECEWWAAFRQLRDGPAFMYEARLWEKDQERRRVLRALQRMTAEEFYAAEVQRADDPREPIEALLGPKERRPWLANVDAARVEQEKQVASLRRALKRGRQELRLRREIWSALIAAKTPDAVRKECRRWARLPDVQEQIQGRSVRARWSQRYGGRSKGRKQQKRWCSPEEIAAHAEQFLATTRSERFPKRKDSSQVDYVSRGMAGVFVNASPLTAIRLLRNMKHDDRGPLWDKELHCCICWRCEEEEDNRMAWRVARQAQREAAGVKATLRKRLKGRGLNLRKGRR